MGKFKRLICFVFYLIILLNIQTVSAQSDNLIKGRVSDSLNNPLQGVTVEAKGENQFVVTDANGFFTVSVKNLTTSVLDFSFIGYQAKEVAVAGNRFLNVVLSSTSATLSDVVVVGYGKQKRVNLTGAVASVSGDQIANRPVTNISTALQGLLPGVAVIQQSGQPGRDNGIIRVRGVGTMNDAAPMVVVDGIVSSMEDLNPNDIESVSVLKDASAGAIYGSRAANGVILVTTKRGKTGAPQVNYNGYVGVQKLTSMPEYLDSYDYAKLLNEGLKNEGQPARYTDAELEKFRTGSDPVNYPNTDWIGLLYSGSGIQNSHNLSVAGGSDASKYLLSLGYLDQQGLIQNTNSNRYNVRFNLDSKISQLFSVGVTSTLSRQNINEPAGVATRSGIGELIRQANRIPPTVLNKYPNGTWARHIDGNPIAWAEDGGLRSDIASHVLGDVFAELNLAKGLKLRGSAGVDYNMIDRTTQLKDITYGDGSYQGPNSLTDLIGRSTRTILQSLLTYNTSFGSHNLNVLLGTSRESFRYDEDNAYRQDFPNNGLTELNAGATLGMTNGGYSY
ncbi:MAG TPA: SusC/RagA family TonB-linked outer membrane protein, partial [Flavisolibacter sp.]|nr:SusC/RagA family TonB-linked outer membrane protein [Flavisolibacter sp.]